MKNGHLPDHWQIWLWIGIAALILAAVARQYAIDIRGMSGFNANLIFLGVFVVFALLYLAFQEFISRTLGTALVKCFEKLFKWLGFKQREPENIEPVSKPEEITETPPASVPIQQPQSAISTETAPQNGIVKIETPTPKKIVIDYEGRREEAKKRQEDRAYEKEANVILYVGYTISPFVDKDVVEKIINIVTEFIHTSGVPDFSEDMAIRLPAELTTSDMMHFGWNIAKPFNKYNLHTAHFLKQAFPYTFKDVEVCTIERKLTCNGTQGRIKIDKNVGSFKIPDESAEVETPTDNAPVKTVSEKKPSKPKKAAKSVQKPKRAMSAMEAAMMDMGLDPDGFGNEVFEDSDGYRYDTGW